MSEGSSSLLRRLAGAPRLVLAALLLIVGTAGALASAAPTPQGAVVVTTHAVAAGSVLTVADLRARARPRSDVPEHAVAEPAAAVGRRVVGAVAAGEVLTSDRVVATAFTPPTGRAVAAVAVGRAAAAFVVPGDRVDVALAAGSAPAVDLGEGSGPGPPAPVVVTHDARVLAVWPDAGNAERSTVVLDVAATEAAAVSVIGSDDLVVGLVAKGT